MVFGTVGYSEVLVNRSFEIEANLPNDYEKKLDLVITMDKNFCRYEGNF